VLARFRALLRRSRTARVVVALIVTGLLGLSLWHLGRHLWAGHQLQAARAALDRGRVEEARVYLQKCLEVRPQNPDVHLLLARAARRAGEYAKAGEHLAQAEKLGAVPEEVALEWQLQAVQRGELAGVENQLWAYADKGHPDRLDILDALARGYLATYRLGAAQEALDLLLRAQPDCASAWRMRGQAIYYMRGFGEAEANYRRAVELDPDDREARRLLADCLSENNKPADAMAEYERLLAQVPGDRPAQLGKARCLVALARHEEAREALEALLKLDPRQVAVLTLLGKVQIRLGDPAAAERWLRQAVVEEPSDREAVYNLGQALQQQGKKDEAAPWVAQLKRIDAEQARLSALTKQIMASPRDAALRCQAGEIFLAMGNEKEGMRWLQSALQEDPRCTAAHRLLRDHYVRQGRADLAAVHERALAQP
jgi:tetratricopeptide (TPR) repeat protein